MVAVSRGDAVEWQTPKNVLVPYKRMKFLEQHPEAVSDSEPAVPSMLLLWRDW